MGIWNLGFGVWRLRSWDLIDSWFRRFNFDTLTIEIWIWVVRFWSCGFDTLVSTIFHPAGGRLIAAGRCPHISLNIDYLEDIGVSDLIYLFRPYFAQLVTVWLPHGQVSLVTAAECWLPRRCWRWDHFNFKNLKVPNLGFWFNPISTFWCSWFLGMLSA